MVFAPDDGDSRGSAGCESPAWLVVGEVSSSGIVVTLILWEPASQATIKTTIFLSLGLRA